MSFLRRNRRVIASFLLLTPLALPQATSAQQPAPPARLPSPEQQIERVQRTIHDYGNLARHHDEDLKLPLPAPGGYRVVFMGDSITDFWGRSRGDFFSGKPYIDRGISGQVTPQMLLRFRQDVIDLKPKVVVILAGTNDIGGSLGPIPDDAIKSSLISMVELARANQIRVVLSSLTPVCATGENSRAERVAEELRRPAGRHISRLLFEHSKMVDNKGMLRAGLTVDGLHPNDAGYAIMAPLAESAIQKALH